MTNLTRENIEKKRKRIRKRRRILYGRIFIAILFFGALITAIGWCSMHVYTWAKEKYDIYAAQYNEYEARRAIRAANFDPRFNEYTNILIVGLDNGSEDEGKQADTILLLSYCHTTGAVRVLHIPRYTLTNIPSVNKEERINQAFLYGGVSLLEDTTENMLNITCHHYIVIDPEVLKEFVDILGGMDIYVENAMDYEDPEGDLYIHIPKGFQHMDGDTMQKYLRYSSDELGVLGRNKRQRAFVKAFFNKICQPEMVGKITPFMEICMTKVDSSVERFDIAELSTLILGMDKESLQLIDLPGARNADGSWVYDKEQTQAIIEDLFKQEENTEGNNEEV